ncbi:unnamed protein product [Pedinophyceae sp. YPF-701]|nr:unnamed protein product [Pedinophyceae sp. YPF-701]
MLRDEAAPDEVFLVQDCPTVCLDDGFDLLDLGEAPGDWMLPDERAALDPALTESTSPGAQLRLRYEYVEAERVFRDLPTRAAMRIGHRAEQDERSAPAAGPSAGMSAATDRKPEPLRALELFPGVGTLSVGLEAAGASKTLWAFEGNVDAAFAMQASLPDAEIFLEDGGHGLRLACAAAAGSVAGDERLPRQGDVELVCGAPPCECLSNPNGGPPVPSMLSFNAFTPMFLSYCEFYQPSLIIMANAPEVATHYGGTTLQKIVRTMLELGYQVRFGEVSARAFGMESDQSWLFVIGARRGRKRIPELPSPAHLHALAGDAMDVDPEKPAAPFGV